MKKIRKGDVVVIHHQWHGGDLGLVIKVYRIINNTSFYAVRIDNRCYDFLGSSLEVIGHINVSEET